MSCCGPGKAEGLPEDLFALQFDDKRGFVGADCLEDEEYQKETDETATPIFEFDEWFTGEICSRCKTLVERS